MATPKRVIRNDEKDYADIYQENFIAQNDPAALGQAAFNRQLGQGLKKSSRFGVGAETGTTGLRLPDGTVAQNRMGMDAGQGLGPMTQNTEVRPERSYGGVGPTESELFRPNPGAGIQMPNLGTVATANTIGTTTEGLRNAMSGIRQRQIYDAQTAARQAQFNALNPGSATQRAGYSPVDRQPVPQVVDAAPRNFTPQGELSSEPINRGAVELTQRQRNQLRRQPEPVATRTADSDTGNPFAIQRQESQPSTRNPRARASAMDKGIGVEESAGDAAMFATPTGPTEKPTPRAEDLYGESRSIFDRLAQDTNTAGVPTTSPATSPATAEPTNPAIAEGMPTGYNNRMGITGDQLNYLTEQRQKEIEQREQTEAKGAAETAARQAQADAIQKQKEEYEASLKVNEAVKKAEEYGAQGAKLTGGGDEAPADYLGSGEALNEGIEMKKQSLLDLLNAEEIQVQQQFQVQYQQFLQMALNRGAVAGNLTAQGFTGGLGDQVRDYLSSQEAQQLNALMMQRDAAVQNIDLQRDNIDQAALDAYINDIQLTNASIEAQHAFGQNLARLVSEGKMNLAQAEAIAEEKGLGSIQAVFENSIKNGIATGTITEEQARAQLRQLGLDEGFLDKTLPDTFEFTEEGEKMANALNTIADAAFDDTLAGGILAGAAAYGAAALVGASWSGPFAFIAGAVGAIAGGIIGASTADAKQIDQQELNALFTMYANSSFAQEYGEEMMNGNFNSSELRVAAGDTGYNGTYAVSLDGGPEKQLTGQQLMYLAVTMKAQGFEGSKYQEIYDAAQKIYEGGRGESMFDDMAGGTNFQLVKLYEATFK